MFESEAVLLFIDIYLPCLRHNMMIEYIQLKSSIDMSPQSLFQSIDETFNVMFTIITI